MADDNGQMQGGKGKSKKKVKKEIFKPRIFTKLHEWGELNFNHGLFGLTRMADGGPWALRNEANRIHGDFLLCDFVTCIL